MIFRISPFWQISPKIASLVAPTSWHSFSGTGHTVYGAECLFNQLNIASVNRCEFDLRISSNF